MVLLNNPEQGMHYPMNASSNGNIFRVTGPLCGEFIADRWIPHTKPGTWTFDVFFDLCLNKWLSEQSRVWWFKTPSRSLWRHCNGVRALIGDSTCIHLCGVITCGSLYFKGGHNKLRRCWHQSIYWGSYAIEKQCKYLIIK